MKNEASPATAAALSPGDLLTEQETADVLKVSVSMLRNRRWRGDTPHFVKLGRCVRYLRADLTAFVNGEAA